MLCTDVRLLKKGPVETNDTLDPKDPTFEGLDLDLDDQLQVRGRLQASGEGDYFWHATLTGTVRVACRRCLTEIAYPLEAKVDVLFSADPDAADDPSVYPLEEPVNEVDVRPAVREEVALAVPAFPLCREDCAGLCPHCGANLNLGPCGCTASKKSD